MEFKQHPKFKHLWLNGDLGEVWTSLVGTGLGCVDVGEPVEQLRGRIHKRTGHRYITLPRHYGVSYITIHRLMADVYFDGAKLVKHKDGDRANNKISNLIPYTSFTEYGFDQKNKPRTGYPGILYLKNRNLWICNIKLNGKRIIVGTTADKNKIPSLIAKRERIKQFFRANGRVPTREEKNQLSDPVAI